MGASDSIKLGLAIGLSEDEFSERLRARDAAAVGVVVREYTPVLYRTAAHYGLTEEQSDDVIQNTWEAFFAVVPRFEGRSQIRTFLIGILLNKARELRRAGKRYQEARPIETVNESEFDASGNWAYRPASPDEFSEALQTEKHLAECLEKISETHRTALFLKEWEEENSLTICKILAITETNLGVMIHRAKKTLRLCLEQKAMGLRG